MFDGEYASVLIPSNRIEESTRDPCRYGAPGRSCGHSIGM